MADNQKKVDALLAAFGDKINSLILANKSGKVELTVEVNMSQGFIGSAFLHTKPVTRENINFNEVKI